MNKLLPLISAMDQFSSLKRVKQVNIGNIIYYEEDVFIRQGNRYKCIGKRCSIGKVVKKGIAGHATWKIIKSTGKNAYAVGCLVDKPVANLMRGYDCGNIDFHDEAEYKSGGHLEGTENGKPVQLSDAKKGGMSVGSKHTEGGIKGSVGSEKKPIEFEGEEIILTAPVSSSSDTYEFEGQKLTGKQIASKINQDHGGVSFAEGGEAKSCRCSSRNYQFGGQPYCSRDIIKYINFMSHSVSDRIGLLKK